MRNDNVTERDLFYILDLFEHMRIAYWLDGGWGIDILTERWQREHGDINIDFSAQHTQKVIQKLEDIGYKIEVDWMLSRTELKHEEYGYSNIHPINLNDDGPITQADPEGGNYVFQDDWSSETSYKGRETPCISKETRLLFHPDCDLAKKDHFDIRNLKSIT